MISLIGNAVNSRSAALGSQDESRQAPPVGRGGGRHVEWDTPVAVQTPQLEPSDGEGGRRPPNGPAPSPEDPVHGRRMSLPKPLRVPNALNHLSDTKEFVP